MSGMQKKAMIVHGGWDGHKPPEMAEIFKKMFAENGIDAKVFEGLESFSVENDLESFDLIILLWGGFVEIDFTKEQFALLSDAVNNGAGFAGCHATCDSFRHNLPYQALTGGHFVKHTPGLKEAHVKITDKSHVITKGVQDFVTTDEIYYLLIDPANKILATAVYPDSDTFMPIAWVKNRGKGRVYYCSLGHTMERLLSEPTFTLIKQGFLWASEGKKALS